MMVRRSIKLPAIRTSLFAVFALGLLIRTWGINYGLPYFHFPDEILYLPKTLVMLKSLDPNPHYFMNPPLLTYLYGALMIAYFVIGFISGAFSSATQFGAAYVMDPTACFLIARGATAFMGAATCVVVYRIGKALFSRETGLASAAILAFSYLHLRDSHYAVNDVPATLLMMLSFFFAVKVASKGRLANTLWSGLFAGLAVATKYNTGIILVPIAVAHFLGPCRATGKAVQRLMVAAAAALAGFTIGCPWWLLDSAYFMQDFFAQAALFKKPWFGCSDEIAVLQYMKIIPWGFGLIPTFFLLSGIAAMIRRRGVAFILLAAFPVAYLAILGPIRLFFERFAIPLIPFFAIAAGYGIVFLSGAGRRKLIFAGLILIAMVEGVIFGCRYDYLATLADTRAISRDWVLAHIPAGSKIITERYGPALRQITATAFLNNYEVTDVGAYLSKKDTQSYRREGYRYLITSGNIRDPYMACPRRYPSESAFYNTLDTDLKRLVVISPFKLRYPSFFRMWPPLYALFGAEQLGPTIKIYDLNG